MNVGSNVESESALRGVLCCDEPMSRHTVWAVGGRAERFYRPADLDDLAVFLASLSNDEPVYWIGLGSNLLVRDGGLDGTVVSTAGLLNRLEITTDRQVLAEAGVACAKVARYCARQGLIDAEFLAGIPGTVGGALAMNAGAFGSETWEIVSQVETIDRRGIRRTRAADEYTARYREVSGPAAEWFVAAYLNLSPGNGKASLERIRALLRRRGETQPIGLRSCGSVFRNPQGDYAGRLVEACGLKGARIGGAEVSAKHANFIINTGDASASDIEGLMQLVSGTVQREHHVRLVPEVRVVGTDS